MKRTSLLLFPVLLLSVCFSQTLDDLVAGPLTGHTFVPEAGKFNISSELAFLSSISEFNEDGNEKTFKDNVYGFAEPELSISVLALKGAYALTRNVGIAISVPLILTRDLVMNPDPGFEPFFQDLSGQTGLGDMALGGWLQLMKSEIICLQASVGYTLATGSSIEDTDSTNVSPTGSGHTSIDAGFAADLMLATNILVSAAAGYSLNQEARYSYEGDSWKQKDGNEIGFSTRVTVLAMPRLALGVDIDYISVGERRIDGETIEDSNVKFVGLAPRAGYQLSAGALTVNINTGYLLTLLGTNYPKMSGLSLGALITF
ncbi:MAG: transporter [Fidelibacterota bacterium]|nr:MAG: transporter [Candidatus Neomarinimicrobiota bacterium]